MAAAHTAVVTEGNEGTVARFPTRVHLPLGQVSLREVVTKVRWHSLLLKHPILFTKAFRRRFL